MFNGTTSNVIMFIQAMLKYDPEKRITIDEVLNYGYFKDSPLMCLPSLLPSYPELRYPSNIESDIEQSRKRKLQEEEDEETRNQPIGPFNRLDQTESNQ